MFLVDENDALNLDAIYSFCVKGNYIEVTNKSSQQAADFISQLYDVKLIHTDPLGSESCIMFNFKTHEEAVAAFNEIISAMERGEKVWRIKR